TNPRRYLRPPQPYTSQLESEVNHQQPLSQRSWDQGNYSIPQNNSPFGIMIPSGGQFCEFPSEGGTLRHSRCCFSSNAADLAKQCLGVLITVERNGLELAHGIG